MKEAEDDRSLGLGGEDGENQATGSDKSNEADLAGGDSCSGSFDRDCNKEQDRRYENKVEESNTFISKLWNEKGSSVEALKEACCDLKEQMVLAAEDNEEILQLEGYSNDLVQSLKEEKDSVSELIVFMDDMIANFQAYMDDDGKEGKPPKTKNQELSNTADDGEEKAGKAGKDKNGAEEVEEVFLDAKEDGSFTSITSKTQHTAGDSQHGTAKDAVPHPTTKEGGQGVTAAPGHGDG